MKKGQISLDLLLTMILALMITTAFLGIITEFKVNQENRLAKEQVTQIAQNTGSLITSTTLLADTTFLISTNIPKIKYVDSDNQPHNAYPKITLVDDNTLNVAIALNNKTIDSNVKITKTSTTIIDTSLLEYDGTLVIRNA